MKRSLIDTKACDFPEEIRDILTGADVYDSSCSKEAKVFFIDKGAGYFLKSAPAHSLEKEALLSRYFHSIGLGANIISYISKERDWLLSERVQGEDLTHAFYLSEPEKLCDTLAKAARFLHDSKFQNCPVNDRVSDYFSTVYENFERGIYDTSLSISGEYPKSAKEAIYEIEKNKGLLKSDTLIHGDFCLPNVIFDGWKFSGFIDLGASGIGDRHIDLFWCAWTLYYNLGTDKYRDRFFDAYGREAIDKDALRTVMLCEAFG